MPSLGGQHGEERAPTQLQHAGLMQWPTVRAADHAQPPCMPPQLPALLPCHASCTECLFTTPTKGNKAAAAHNLRFSSGPAASPGPRTPGVGLKGLGSAPAASPCPCTPGAGPKTRGSSGCNAYMQPPSPRSSAAAPLPPKLAILKDLLGKRHGACALGAMRFGGRGLTAQPRCLHLCRIVGAAPPNAVHDPPHHPPLCSPP